MSFVHFPDRPERLDAEFVAGRYAELAARVATAEAAESPDEWLALYSDWNELGSYVVSEGKRHRYRHSQRMDDEATGELERVFRREVVPVSEAAHSELVAALLGSRHKAALGARFGTQLVRVFEIGQEPLAPINSELRIQEVELARSIDKRIAKGVVTVGGASLTLARARGLQRSPEAAVRREAFEAHRGWFLERRDELAEIFTKMVALRDRMGRNLSHASFVPLGYAGMGRTDYGPAEVAQFRDAVERHVSPLFRAGCEAQARALGAPTLRPWDAMFHPDLTLPNDAAGPAAAQLDKAERVFDRLSPRLAEHFRHMRSEDLIDLENRENKRAGAFCTAFPDEAKVAIFCNSIGDEGDVKTLMHEMGHAFQAWESQWIEAIDLRWPTMDACELHSMGMEFLSLPYLDEFFAPEQAARFARGRWQRAVELLCYVCTVDAFQHWIYEHPAASPDERDATWIGLQETYMPGVDWSGDASRYAATRWYAQSHIFGNPFYYIDYAIAETGAMQLGMLDVQDHERCLATYLELCRLGGTVSVLEMFAGAGLRSPFDPGLIQDLSWHAAARLGLDRDGAAINRRRRGT